MATKNLRINVRPKRLEADEDRALARIAKERKRTLTHSTGLTHDEVRRQSRVAAPCAEKRATRLPFEPRRT